ncbi:hypothetical protein G9A89_000544, partial [Geosiphon pyriformis]
MSTVKSHIPVCAHFPCSPQYYPYWIVVAVYSTLWEPTPSLTHPGSAWSRCMLKVKEGPQDQTIPIPMGPISVRMDGKLLYTRLTVKYGYYSTSPYLGIYSTVVGLLYGIVHPNLLPLLDWTGSTWVPTLYKNIIPKAKPIQTFPINSTTHIQKPTPYQKLPKMVPNLIMVNTYTLTIPANHVQQTNHTHGHYTYTMCTSQYPIPKSCCIRVLNNHTNQAFTTTLVSNPNTNPQKWDHGDHSGTTILYPEWGTHNYPLPNLVTRLTTIKSKWGSPKT